ncbi:MAG: hypothetical protein RRY73_03445 [Alistipes sp.]
MKNNANLISAGNVETPPPYFAPEVETLDVSVEQGFFTSVAYDDIYGTEDSVRDEYEEI